ncbi:MAG TPA: UvrD-helicase domain-containing protein [Thermoanaerobaculia bacterium]|nr:UvrD-helicase domain-containing protein [Thermoanaerobaculia bacterium]
MKASEPSRPLADRAARDAIAGDLDATILVEAAAGTGKTESLVARMVALVRTGRATIDRLCAVTFTIKAAAELSQRFQTRLEQAARGAAWEERPRLEAALDRLDAAFVGTIHAFCARLLRERPVEAGVDPGFSEMDQPEDAVARDEAWDRYTERLFSEDSPFLPRLSALGVKLDELRQTFDALSENEDVPPAIEDEPPPPDFSATRGAVATFLDRAAAELPAEAPADGWTEYQSAVRRALRLHALLDEVSPAGFIRVVEVLERAEGQAKDAGRLRGDFEALVRDHLGPALVAWREYLHPILMSIVAPAVRDYAAWRRRNGRLNFQDLLLYARDLLREHPDVRRAFQARFLPILVDEFQDTDPIQAEILLYLTGTDTAGLDWRALTPLPGSLFVVGDPKQSIYRFRRADVETYALVRERIASSGRILALTTNFRATGRLCDWVNRVFRAEFPPQATREQAAFAAFEPYRDPGGPPVYRLETRTTTSASDPVIEQDSRRIARAIEADVRGGARRPADFLVLFRTRRHMAAYARELEALGLPYELAGGGAFQDSEELAALLTVLAAISDPDDPVPLVATLRGPLFGVDDEALYRHHAVGGRFAFRGALPENADPRLARAFALLTEGEALADRLPPGAAISRICESLGWIAAGAARELGDSRAGNLLKALAAARTLSGEGLDFKAVVRELTGMAEAGYIEEMSVEPGRRDAVRLLTVHGAKGLEAPVVFLADPRADKPKAPKSWIDRSGESARGYWRIVRETEEFRVIEIARPAGWDAMAEIEARFEEAERKRTLYVAATRAREMLVVSTWRQGKGKPKGAWSALDAYITEDLPEPAPPPAAEPAPPLRDLPAELAAFQARRAARQQVSERPTAAVSSVTAVAHAGPAPDWERTGRGMSWGRVVHRLLEALMRDGGIDVGAYAANLLAEEDRPPGDVEELVRTVDGVRSSDLWKRAAGARRRLVEVPFALLVPRGELGLPEGGPAETLLQGAIDLVFEDADGWVLVDYKSDTVGANLDSLVAYYTPQVAAYRRYWERLTGRAARAGLFFVQGGREVWLPES